MFLEGCGEKPRNGEPRGPQIDDLDLREFKPRVLEQLSIWFVQPNPNASFSLTESETTGAFMASRFA